MSEKISIKSAFSLFSNGKPNEALTICDNLLQFNKNNVDAINLTAIIKDASGKKEEALQFFLKASKLLPSNTDILGNIASTYLDLGQYNNAKQYLNQIVKIDPLSAKAWFNLANIAFNEKKHSAAIKLYKKTIDLKPDHYQALLNLAKLYSVTGQIEEAHQLYIQVNNIDPQNTSARIEHARLSFNIGLAYYNQAKYKKALHYLKISNKLEPDNADTVNALGVVYQELGEKNNAASCYKQAVLLSPENAVFHNNLGFLYTKLEQLNLAEKHLKKSLALAPQSQSVQNNLSMFELLTQDYKNGWSHYRYRNSVQQSVYEFPPVPPLDHLQNKKVLILSEQGIGDELFFLRFMEQFKSTKAIVDYLPCQRLLPLLKPLNLVDRLLPSMPDKRCYDYCISIGDLPYLLEHDGSNNPPPLSLILNNDSLKRVKQVLQEFGPPPYIGLTWQAGGIRNSKLSGSYYKEIDLASLCAAIEGMPGSIVAMQKNVSQQDLNTLSTYLTRPILNAAVYHDDLENMLSLLSLIDTYISVSNTNIHLREGLQKLSHALICSPPEWRWQVHSNISTWFPNSRIYRQTPGGSWQSAISELTTCLNESN